MVKSKPEPVSRQDSDIKDSPLIRSVSGENRLDSYTERGI